MKSTWMSSRKSNNKRKSKNRWMKKMMSMPTMINSRRAQDQRLVLKVAYQAVDLAKKPKKVKKLTCPMTWGRMMMMMSMKMK